MNASLINSITKIVNPFTVVDMGIEEYSKYCKRISDILRRTGNTFTGVYDTITARGDAIMLVSCIVEVLAEMVLCKNPYVIDYWRRISEIKPHLVNLIDESLLDDDESVIDSISKVSEIFFAD